MLFNGLFFCVVSLLFWVKNRGGKKQREKKTHCRVRSQFILNLFSKSYLTAEWAFMRAEDAMDNAALAAILYLERGLGTGTHRCKISPVGEVPQLGPLQYMARRGEFATMLASQSAALSAERVRLYTCSTPPPLSSPPTLLSSLASLSSSPLFFAWHPL